MLRRFALLVTVGALLLTPMTVLAQAGGANAPKLDVPEKIKDFGTVPQGEIIHANFQLVNEGTAKLVVKAVRPTCGCTVAEYDKEVAPGRAGLIKAKVDTSAFTGPITKSILVLTNDPETPTTTLVVKANVKPYLEVLPRPIVRFNTVRGEAVEHELKIVTDDAVDFKITKVTASVPFITATIHPLSGDELVAGKYKVQYGVKLILSEDAPIGAINATVTLHTNHPHAKTVKIKAFGVVRSLLHVTPGNLQFGSVEAKFKPGRNVIVVNNRKEPVEVTGAKVDDPAFTAEVLPIEQGKRYQVTVMIKPDAKPGVHETVLHIMTTDPQHKDLQVRIRASIK
ncbi:MAG: DUF1573 domain-containing protein [Acidobacteria bacterium]|nr:DUF1573 domain-containing protein [Acidobacteriota bacterium]